MQLRDLPKSQQSKLQRSLNVDRLILRYCDKNEIVRIRKDHVKTKSVLLNKLNSLYYKGSNQSQLDKTNKWLDENIDFLYKKIGKLDKYTQNDNLKKNIKQFESDSRNFNVSHTL